MTTASTPSSLSKTTSTTDPLQLIDVDHVRFFVGNAKQAAYFYAHTFGFQISQYADLTTGSREEANYLLTQGNIRLILTTGLNKDHIASQEVFKYGDGVKDVAFTVFDAEKAYEKALANGAESAYEPATYSDEKGAITKAGIKIFGRAVHSFVSRTGEYALPKVKQGGLISPGFARFENLAINEYNQQNTCGLKYVDHCVGNVELGKMNHWGREIGLIR